MTTTPDESRALIRYGLIGFAVTVALMWATYLVREALLLIYISTLVAIGFGPIVTAIERRRVAGRRKLPQVRRRRHAVNDLRDSPRFLLQTLPL